MASYDNDENNTTSFPNFVSTGKASVFSYKGREITTQFNLSPDQNGALEKLIDFSMSNKKVITLEGAAGTGKTTIIGYLQKYLGNVGSFAFMAPTHSATAELAFATVKTCNTDLPSTVASSVTINKLTGNYVFSKKVKRKFATNPIIVIDESSMLSLQEVQKLLAAAEEAADEAVIKVETSGYTDDFSIGPPANRDMKHIKIDLKNLNSF
jgi:tRNA(Met) C34 N-acetyltransferase TmcA